jgi:ankyrin repeat protein
LTRKRTYDIFSEVEYTWSEAGFKAVADIVTSLLSSSWASQYIDKEFMDQGLNESGDDVDYIEHTMLFVAASCGHTAIVEALLSDARRVDKAYIDQQDECGCTALICAARVGHASVIQLLLADSRVDKYSIDHADSRGYTALISAAEHGHESVIELLLADARVDKASIDHTHNGSWTAIMYAAMKGYTSAFQLFLADARVDKASIVYADFDRHDCIVARCTLESHVYCRGFARRSSHG